MNEKPNDFDVTLPENFSPDSLHVRAPAGVDVKVTNHTGKPITYNGALADLIGDGPLEDEDEIGFVPRPGASDPVTIHTEAHTILCGLMMKWERERTNQECARELANTLGNLCIVGPQPPFKEGDEDENEGLSETAEAAAEVVTTLAGFTDQSRIRALRAAAALLGVKP